MAKNGQRRRITQMQDDFILAMSPYVYVDRFGNVTPLPIIDFVPVFLAALLLGVFFRVRRTRVYFGVALIWGSVVALVILFLLFLFGPITIPA